MAGQPVDAELEVLVRRFSRLVRAAAARVGGTPGRRIADDVEQQVFLSLWKQLGREQSILNPASYLYRCAVRETVRLLHHERKEADAQATERPELDGSVPMPDDELARQERSRLMADAVRTLAPDRRRAVQAYLAGFSVAESMTMYGWSYQKARNLVARGIADLRAALRERGIDG
jgi:RNA polymerase sigma factor (sigma-70 family)